MAYTINDRRSSALGGQSKDRNRSAITTIVWHYSAVARSIRKFITGHEEYWKNILGWDRGGYHFYIDADGNIWQNYDYERITWGVYNNNGYCVHISVEAGSGTDYSQAQIDARDWLTRKIMADLSIPASKVKGHREVYNNSACPGYSIEQMDAFRARLGKSAAAVSEPIAPMRVPVNYNKMVAYPGYSIDSKPWGEPGLVNWGNTSDHVGKVFSFYEENGSGEYANGVKVGWIDKRALAKEKTVVASILYLPNGQTWTVYEEGSEYKVGQVISTEAPGEDDGLYLTVLGDKGNNILIVDLPDMGQKAIYFDKDKGATITQKFA